MIMSNFSKFRKRPVDLTKPPAMHQSYVVHATYVAESKEHARRLFFEDFTLLCKKCAVTHEDIECVGEGVYSLEVVLLK
jgi:hypothetical protein